MNIAICDTNALDSISTKEYLYSYFYGKNITYHIYNFEEPETLKDEIQDGKFFDIIFTDTCFKNYSGIQFARTLRNINFNGEIVLVTSDSHYAVEGYDIDISGYIVKPYTYECIARVLSHIMTRYYTNDFYYIQRSGHITRLNHCDIIYIESMNSKCIIHSVSGENYTVYKKLNTIEEELDDKNFLRCHQSYLVNMMYIKTVGKYFELKNGDIIPIRQRNLRAIKENYLGFMRNKNRF